MRLPYRIVEPKIQQKVQSKDGPIETKEQDCAIAGLAFKCIHHTSIEEATQWSKNGYPWSLLQNSWSEQIYKTIESRSLEKNLLKIPEQFEPLQSAKQEKVNQNRVNWNNLIKEPGNNKRQSKNSVLHTPPRFP